MFGKKQNFGATNTFASPEYLVGRDQFGRHNWGLQESDLPANDKKSWDDMVAKDPEYVPERIQRKRVMTLQQKDDAAQKTADAKKAEVKKAAAAKSKADAVKAIEKAAKAAQTDAKNLMKVEDLLGSMKN